MLQGIFSLLNSKKNSDIEISTILLNEFNDENYIIDKKDFASIHVSNNTVPSIKVTELNRSKVNYKLFGKIISEKSFLNSIEKIETKTEVLEQIFYIRNKIKIKRYEREEFNNISIYDYTKNCMVRIPKNINFLKFELYIEIMNCKEHDKIGLVAEKFITI